MNPDLVFSLERNFNLITAEKDKWKRRRVLTSDKVELKVTIADKQKSNRLHYKCIHFYCNFKKYDRILQESSTFLFEKLL